MQPLLFYKVNQKKWLINKNQDVLIHICVFLFISFNDIV